jgi:hypothetical protein
MIYAEASSSLHPWHEECSVNHVIVLLLMSLRKDAFGTGERRVIWTRKDAGRAFRRRDCRAHDVERHKETGKAYWIQDHVAFDLVRRAIT